MTWETADEQILKSFLQELNSPGIFWWNHTHYFKIKLVIKYSRYDIFQKAITRNIPESRSREFCSEAVRNQNLEFLRFLRSPDRTFPWDHMTMAYAAQSGNIEIIDFLISQNCPFDEWAIGMAKDQGIKDYLLDNLHGLSKERINFIEGFLAKAS